MDNIKIASELVKLAKELSAGEFLNLSGNTHEQDGIIKLYWSFSFKWEDTPEQALQAIESLTKKVNQSLKKLQNMKDLGEFSVIQDAMWGGDKYEPYFMGNGIFKLTDKNDTMLAARRLQHDGWNVS